MEVSLRPLDNEETLIIADLFARTDCQKITVTYMAGNERNILALSLSGKYCCHWYRGRHREVNRYLYLQGRRDTVRLSFGQYLVPPRTRQIRALM